MGRAVTRLQYSRGQDLMTLKCLQHCVPIGTTVQFLAERGLLYCQIWESKGFFHRTVNSNVRGFTVSLHLGYFLAVGSFMVLINLGKRIYCQKQESLCAFLVIASNRVSERSFVCLHCQYTTLILLPEVHVDFSFE